MLMSGVAPTLAAHNAYISACASRARSLARRAFAEMSRFVEIRRKKKVKYLYFQNPDVPPPARRFRQGDGRFDAPPDWAEKSQGTHARSWALQSPPRPHFALAIQKQR